jgi:hypothetical protein
VYVGYYNNPYYSFINMTNNWGVAGVAPSYDAPGLLTKSDIDKELKRHEGFPGGGHW